MLKKRNGLNIINYLFPDFFIFLKVAKTFINSMNIHRSMGSSNGKSNGSSNNHNSASKIKTKILKYMEDMNVVTSSEITNKLNLSWNTAEKRLLELALEGKITRLKKAGVNLWILKKD